ncbi:hypothetical protein V2J09_004280 [Rumex salicifolius]
MADQILLPSSVEFLIQQISTEQLQPLPDTLARRELASLGEEASLRLLSDIRNSKINRTFSGFIMYLANKYRSFRSPRNFASPPPVGVALPASVEELIQTICNEQSQPPLGVITKRKLALLGEEDALRLLDIFRRNKVNMSFEGFVACLTKNDSHSPASPKQESISFSPSRPATSTTVGSPNFCAVDMVTNLVQDRFALSPISAARQPGGPYILPCINNRQYNEQGGPSDASSIATPNGQTFCPLTNVGNPTGRCLTFSPVSPSRLFGGPSTFPCISNRQYFEQDGPSSDTSSVRTFNGQTFSSLTNVGSPSGQCLTRSPISAARQPVKPSIFPCINNWQSNGQVPFEGTNVGTHYRQTFAPSTNVGNRNGNCLMPSAIARKPCVQISGSLLHALHELEFRKAFMILSYIGRHKLEEVTTVEEIKDLAAVHSMGEFEDRIWYRFGSHYCEKKDRVKQLDWESRRGHYYYHCYVYSDGTYSLKGPFLNKTATLLQKCLGDENVLIVKFYDLDSSRKYYGQSVFYTEYHKLAEEGICVGLKRFRFFAFKDGGKEEKKNSSSGAIKSYYVNVDSFARFYESKVSFFDMMSIHDQRCIFMHVHNLSSLSAYMARFSLILSKTITLEVDLNDPDVHVEVIDDVPCKDVNGSNIYDKDGKLQIHTDGTGYISEELALRCPQNCFKGASLYDRFFERYHGTVGLETTTCQFKPDMLQPPLLIQFRMFYKGLAVKGTVLVNKKLPGKTIQIRPSMIKVEPDPGLPCIPAVNSFEIVSTSMRPRRPHLSRNLIALLNYGGIPRDFFISILVNEICDAHNIFLDKHAALKVAVNYGEIDDNYTVARMIFSGIPLDESYIQWKLPILGKVALTGLKQGKLPIQDSFYVMGTVDPTGSLNSNEVCIIHETGQFEGEVLVYRTPGVHFGDVHKLKATRVKGLEDIVGTSKYGIFFPINGPRSLADKMAGGDYDGDMYFVSRHPELLRDFRQSEPWNPAPLCSQSTSFKTKPSDFTAEHLEHELFRSFLTTSYTAGKAANCWLSYMDQMLSLGDEQKVKKLEIQNKLLRLVDIYYEALDAPKKGKKVEVPRDLIPKSYPHFMGQADQYRSTSVLGEIFDKADELQLKTPAVQVWKLPRFDIEVPLRCIILWEDYYESYRSEMSSALNSGNQSERDAAASKVIQNYKQTLFGADELEKSPRAWEEIRFDALAIYHVVYSYAMQSSEAKKCAFAWRVAGSALIKIYMEEQDEKPIYCLPSVLREVL